MKTQINYFLKANSSKSIKIRNISIPPNDKEIPKSKESNVKSLNSFANKMACPLVQKSKYISILNNESMQFSQCSSNPKENEKIFKIPKEVKERTKSINIKEQYEQNEAKFDKEKITLNGIRELNAQINLKIPFEKKIKMHNYQKDIDYTEYQGFKEIRLFEQIKEMKERNETTQNLISSLKLELDKKHQENLNLYNSYQQICFECNCIKKKLNSLNSLNEYKIYEHNNPNDKISNIELKDKVMRNKLISKKMPEIQRSSTLDKNKINLDKSKIIEEIDQKSRIKQLSPTQNKFNSTHKITPNPNNIRYKDMDQIGLLLKKQHITKFVNCQKSLFDNLLKKLVVKLNENEEREKNLISLVWKNENNNTNKT